MVAVNGKLDDGKSQPRPLPSSLQANGGSLSREHKPTTKPGSATPQLELPGEASAPLRHTRCCVIGLLSLAAIRGCAVSVYTSPAGLARTAHMLSCASDGIAIVGSLPVFATSTSSSCVHHRCLGSLLTLLLTATICDVGAVIIYLIGIHGILSRMGPIAMDGGAPEAVAFVGVWECILVASVALEMALCVSAWNFYRVFREAGIKLPNISGARIYKEVSPLELVCEAEDVARLSNQCTACNGTSSRNTDILAYSATTEDPKLINDGEVHADGIFICI